MEKFKPFLIFFLFITTCLTDVYSQDKLDYYLPGNTSYNEKIPKPSEIIGHEVGEFHVSHDRLVNYMKALAAASERVTIKTFGYTYEKRPLVLLTITSEKNQENIEYIKEQHVQLTDPEKSSSLDLSTMPAVIYMGYSIHGNEPSGSNASLAVAYHLAAAQGEEIEKTLDNVVVLLDPSFNPDGLNRFASWVNTNKGSIEVSDPQNIEQNEPWPRGRTNHYWFDLNRDWLPAQLPESQARLKNFHEWKPNVLTDHHEMGTDRTFFFQPGVPSRNNPLTPANTYILTEKMGEYHALALDQIGSLYYTRESYDDYYFGKGSTYPDINGAVGILFEQASSRSHAQESDHGILRFPFTIRNQFTTSLSTLKAVHELREEFLTHQRDFYKKAQEMAENSRIKAYVFGNEDDPLKAYHLAELFNRHDIKVYNLKQDLEEAGVNFTKESSYIIPMDQPQHRLIEAMFETRTSFTDSLFYDVSTWTLPYAFNLDYKGISRGFSKEQIGEPFKAERPVGEFRKEDNPYAYIFEWNDYYAPQLLYKLMEEDLITKVATEPLGNQGRKFDRGSIVIPARNQPLAIQEIEAKLEELAVTTGVDIHTLSTGLDYGSYSIGSPKIERLEKPRVAVLVGDGVSSYEAGEFWHQMDQRYEIPVTRLPLEDFRGSNLDRYNTLVMVSGSYSQLDKREADKLKDWISRGNNLIVQRSALRWLSRQSFVNLELESRPSNDTSGQKKDYNLLDRYQGAQSTGGAIMEVEADLTHPLLYGYQDSNFATFRNHNYFLPRSKNAFGNPITYTSSPLLSGYLSDENEEVLKNSAMAGTYSYGRGRIILFADNVNFRAFWYGTNKLMANAIFFGSLIDRDASR